MNNRPLPDGLSEADLLGGLARMAEVVGKKWVILEPEAGLTAYYDTQSTLPISASMPSGAVAPANTDELQKVVKIANEIGIPLWTISCGKNIGYGGPAPRKPGTLVLDLKRMNRILEVNVESAYVVVEPGVSYLQLYEHLQKNNIPLWIDCAAPAWGSVLGNAMERGGGYTPYGDHWMMQCGLEVVLADGTLFRTGMGAMENSNTWNLFKYGYGPYIDGIFTQSNFGIATKMGVWLMPEPPGVKPYMITFPREEDLHQIIEIMRPLKVPGVMQNAAVLSNLIWEGAISTTRDRYYRGDGPMPESARQKMAADLELGAWNMTSSLYGPPAVIDTLWQVIEESFSQVKGARIYLADDRAGDPGWEYRKKLMRGQPNMTEFSLLNWTGGGHVDFSPVAPMTGDEAMNLFNICQSNAHEFGFDYVAEFFGGWRQMVQVFMLLFDPEDADQRERANQLFSVLIREAAANGYGEYRTNLSFMDEVAATYDFNDGALWKVHQKIKRALDPKGILAPGKQGIWPL
ncbi:MAG: FAD-binding oxidoreductase [Gammaproteobacteria bacterium]|nr:FAD-binding oxidoreductase [Gammaproteobacteria bacterium]